MVKLSFGEFNGDSWEELCQKCFKIRYRDSKYQRIPADAGGDLGIEGFTRDGLVFQCYCPDQDYPPAEMYEHQRDKITKDLNKLAKNKDILIEKYLGDMKINTWYFVTPYINNKTVIEHCNKKKLEMRGKKLSHLSKDFDVLVMESTDLLREINYLVMVDKSYQLNYPISSVKKDRNWSSCESRLVKNLIRKINAIIPNSETEEGKKKVDRIVEIYMDYYLKGFRLLNILQENHLEMYEKLLSIKSTFEYGVEVKCLMNQNSNNDLFFGIMEELGSVLTDEFKEPFALEMIETLKNQIISSWLLECPMDFR